MTQFTASELMRTPLKEWPEGLQAYTRLVSNVIGISGEVFHACAQEWIDGGCPEEHTEVTALYLQNWRQRRTEESE